jgi:hypothetical protein
MRDVEILGLRIPDAGPIFLAALALHVVAGLTGVIAGALAATAAVLAAIRWEHNRHLFAIAVVAGGSAATGWLALVRNHAVRVRSTR